MTPLGDVRRNDFTCAAPLVAESVVERKYRLAPERTRSVKSKTNVPSTALVDPSKAHAPPSPEKDDEDEYSCGAMLLVPARPSRSVS